MSVTATETLIRLCRLVSTVNGFTTKWEEPADGFCPDCRIAARLTGEAWQSSGTALSYIEEAVMAQLVRDGISILDGIQHP